MAKDSACSKTTKGAPTEGASVPSIGKGTGRRKEIAEGRRRERSSVHGRTMKSIARRVEEEPGACPTTEGVGTLWGRHPRWGMFIQIRIVYGRSNSDIHGVQKVWEKGMSYG